MTHAAVDVISENAGENVRREQARDLAAGVVQALFRLVKQSTLHAIDNQAMVRQVEDTVGIVQDFGQRTGHNVSVLFTHGTVFVCGQLLKANRSVYEGALELADVLKRCGYSEISVARDVRAADLNGFASALAEALRSQRPALADRPAPRIRLRAVSDALLRREASVDRAEDESAAVVRAYATAIVIMRRFYDDLRQGRYVLRQGVKRITQRLVDLSSGETPAFLGVTALRNQNHDDAGRAVNTAILSLAMARQITADIVLLQRLAMAALLYDTARPRLTGAAKGRTGGVVPVLGEHQDLDVPAGTAVVLTALGRVNEPSVMRTVMAYEAHWVKRQAALGAPYRGLRAPTLQARILATARAFNDLLTPAPGQTPITADEAIATLEQDATDPADRSVLRLLVGALGIFPTGTLVELTTGEVALVVQTPTHPARYCLPRVRLVLDGAGGPIPRPVDIDLAESPRPGETARHIRKVVATSDDPAAASMRAHAAAQDAAAARPSYVAPPPDAAIYAPATPPGLGVSMPAHETARPSSPTMPITQSPPAALRPILWHTSELPPAPYDARAPTVRPGKPAARAPEQPVPPPPPVPEPFARSDSYVPPPPALARMQRLAAPPGAEQPERDVHGQATRAMDWDEQAAALGLAEGHAQAEPRSTPRSPAQAEPRPTSVPPPASRTPGAFLVMPEEPPTADGTLARTPLVHLLVYMLDRRLTGTTCFVEPDGVVHGVYFHDGMPAKIWTGTMIAPLDRVILDLGLLDEATLRDTLRDVSKRRMLHGRLLVSRGLLERQTVVAVLREQLARKLIALFDLPRETEYRYWDGVNLLASYGGPELLECEPLALVMAGIRLHADDRMIDATLAKLANRPLGLHIEAEMKRFQLQRDEAAVVDLLRTRRMTLGEVFGAGVAQERVVRRTVYALVISRHLDLGVAGRGPVGLGRERPPPAGPLDPAVIAARNARPPAQAPQPPAQAPQPPAQAPQPPAQAAAAAAQTIQPASGATTPAPRTTRSVSDAPPAPDSRSAPQTPSAGRAERAPAPPPPPARRAPGAAAAPQGGAPARPPPAQAPQAAAASDEPAPSSRSAGAQRDRPPPSRPVAEPAAAHRASDPPSSKATRTLASATPSPGEGAGAAPPQRAAPPQAPTVKMAAADARRVRPPPRAAAPAAPAASPPPPPARPAASPPPPPARPAASPAPPPVAPAELSARRAEIEARAAAVDAEDHFQMLGVRQDAAADQIQAAYFALAKQWHPDRTPPELQEVKPLVARVFARISEAYQTLIDPAKRAEYMSALQHGGGRADDDEKIARVVDAALECQKAEVLLKKRDLAGAEAHIRRALEADPDQPEYVVLHVWILAQRRGEPPTLAEGATTSHYDDLIQTLEAVLHREPSYERALFYRGMLLKRAGRIDKALKDFRAVAEINPKNIDAVREVRLHEMRKRGAPDAPSPQGGGGLFGKLFKR